MKEQIQKELNDSKALRWSCLLYTSIIDQVPYNAAFETAVANVESAKAGLKGTGVVSMPLAKIP